MLVSAARMKAYCAAVVRRALLGMGPTQDADLGAAQAALRDSADPLSSLCHPGHDGEFRTLQIRMLSFYHSLPLHIRLVLSL
jgi:hypothetical protein